MSTALKLELQRMPLHEKFSHARESAARSNTRKYWKEEDNDDYVEPRRSHKPRAKVVLPEREAKPRQFAGMGGHMTVALLQKMTWYDELIKAARIWLKESKTKQEAKQADERINSLVRGRSHYMKKIRERLTERGYHGPYPVHV